MLYPSPWRLEDQRASLSLGPLSLAINLAAPERGAEAFAFGGHEVSNQLWAWRPSSQTPQRLSDAYVRGSDLVSEYAPSEEFPFKTQIYWRCEAEATRDTPVRLSLILSVHTHKLDTHPIYSVESSFRATGPATLQQDLPGNPYAGVLMTADNSAWSVVETIQPGDLLTPGGQTLEAESGQTVSRWRLFDHFMEKGVIRRAQLSLALASGAMSQVDALSVCDQLRATRAANDLTRWSGSSRRGRRPRCLPALT